MNIRCAFCQTPYTLSRNEILFALQKMDSENLNHYDAHCPRCRRATQLPRQRVEMAFPNWRQAVAEAESAPTPVVETPKATAVVAVQKPAEKVVKKTPVKKSATPKPAKKPASKAVTTSKKPAKVKKTPAKKSK